MIPESLPKDTPVLVVDDVRSARSVVSRMLKGMGFTSIEEAASVEEALKKISLQEIKLVITDLHLKDAKGTDLVAKAQKTSSNPIYFVIITSDMDKNSFENAFQQGVSAYLLKPFSSAALAEKIALVAASAAAEE